MVKRPFYGSSETINWRSFNPKTSSSDRHNRISQASIADGEMDIFENGGWGLDEINSLALTLLGSECGLDDHKSYLNNKYNSIGKISINELSCWYTNPTSLNNKMADFTCWINIDKPDILFIAETWWNGTSIP
jgi:hypothetical protein